MRLIDADALKRKIEESGVDGTIANYVRRTLAATLDNEPTVHAVPVVRCNDCRHKKLAGPSTCKRFETMLGGGDGNGDAESE